MSILRLELYDCCLKFCEAGKSEPNIFLSNGDFSMMLMSWVDLVIKNQHKEIYKSKTLQCKFQKSLRNYKMFL